MTRPPVPAGDAILIVEDEEMVRAYLRIVLENEGFTTLEAGNGAEAIRVFEANPGRISAVVLDLTLPQVAGVEVCNRLRAMRPELPILLISGHNDPELPADLRNGPVAFLGKPFLPDQLLTLLRQLVKPR